MLVYFIENMQFCYIYIVTTSAECKEEPECGGDSLFNSKDIKQRLADFWGLKTQVGFTPLYFHSLITCCFFLSLVLCGVNTCLFFFMWPGHASGEICVLSNLYLRFSLT